MGNFKDIAGKKYNHLTVLKRIKKPKDKIGTEAWWLVKCDCGIEKIISGTVLRTKNINSCGCFRALDETGKKFHWLTVIKRIKSNNPNFTGAFWLCKCICGKTTKVRGSNLRKGHVKSCGCLGKHKGKKAYGLSAKKAVFCYYRYLAKKKNRGFYLSFKKLIKITSQNCYYCGEKPSNRSSNGFNNGDYLYNGIDRKNNNLGYTTNNCVPCCKICNIAKNNRNEKEFYKWIKKVWDKIKWGVK